MKEKKLESLQSFEMTKNEMKKAKGGWFEIHWLKPEDSLQQTFDIATYVDGFNMGTDGYLD